MHVLCLRSMTGECYQLLPAVNNAYCIRLYWSWPGILFSRQRDVHPGWGHRLDRFWSAAGAAGHAAGDLLALREYGGDAAVAAVAGTALRVAHLPLAPGVRRHGRVRRHDVRPAVLRLVCWQTRTQGGKCWTDAPTHDWQATYGARPVASQQHSIGVRPATLSQRKLATYRYRSENLGTLNSGPKLPIHAPRRTMTDHKGGQ